MTNKTLNAIKDAKAKVDTATQSGVRSKAVDALKNIMVNRSEDIIDALELYAVLEEENDDLKKQIENLTAELDKADEEYNTLQRQLRASEEKAVSASCES